MRIGAFTQYWDQLRTKGKFTAARTPGLPWLGLGLKAADDGLLVVSVERDGLGAAAGVQKDDVVMQMGEAGITSLPQFQNEYLKLVRAGSREVVLTVLRDDRRVSISISLPGPPQDDSLVIPELQDLASLMAGDEQRLDDVTVVISSQVGGRAASVVGTLLADGRSIVSKASRVGPAAVVKLRTGERIPLTTIGRDDGNDLILLRADTSLGRTGLAIGEPEAVQAIRRGRLLLSPLPRGPGFVSTVGSDVFESPSRSQRGYLGVRMNAQGGHVRIMSVERTSAAGRSGLRAGDVLLGVDGRDVAAPADVFGILRQKSPGDRVVLVVERDGSQIGKRIKLGTRPEPKRHAADFFSGGKSRRRDGFSLAFTHDATLKPQECGGPVFDLAGNFVGLNIARHSRAQTYAVPASVVLAFVRSQPPAPDETSSDRDGSAD